MSTPPVPAFAEVYEAHFAFVHRTVRQLGADPAAVDDVVQEVFLVVHRRLPTFEGRASLKTWLYGIVRRIVRDHRRSRARKPTSPADDLDAFASPTRDPHELSEDAEAARILLRLLDELDDDRREVFVLTELEQLSAREIAEATGTNVNTVSTRLRAARAEFAAALARHHRRQEHGAPLLRVAAEGR